MDSENIVAYIGLGANLGDRWLNLQQALKELAALPTIEIGPLSSVYETAPVGMTEQPDFLNMAAQVRTTLSARGLLDALLHIETEMGRTRTVRWGPRVIDLDLLVFGDIQITLPGLVVPHPRLQERDFVLMPLVEIAPTLVLPGSKQTAERVLKNLSGKLGTTGNIRRVESV